MTYGREAILREIDAFERRDERVVCIMMHPFDVRRLRSHDYLTETYSRWVQLHESHFVMKLAGMSVESHVMFEEWYVVETPFVPEGAFCILTQSEKNVLGKFEPLLDDCLNYNLRRSKIEMQKRMLMEKREHDR